MCISTLVHNALPLGDMEAIIQLVLPAVHAEVNAILLSGRVPGHKTDDIQILISSTTKKVV